MSSHVIGSFIALIAAISWSGGDFSGGIAARKLHQYQVLFLTSLSSLAVLFTLALVWGEGLPSPSSTVIAFLAGTSGALGLAAFYKGLSIGNTAIVAPVGGVFGSIIPVIVGIFIEGFPGYLPVIGFALALLGIWFVTKVDGEAQSKLKTSLSLAFMAGIGFGGFLTLIALVDDNQIFSPLAVAKFASLILASILIWRNKLPIPKLGGSGMALVSGVLDAGGNLFYLLATQYTRIDIAAVLSSLYPAGTVLLSMVFLKEKIMPFQWIGVGLCLSAIMLITIG